MRHSSFLEVNLSLLGENYKNIQALAPRAELLPMVKADAYGNGLVPVARFLREEMGAKIFGCASLGEALKLFQELPQFDGEVLVCSECVLGDEKARRAYLDLRISPVIHHRSDLELMLKLPELKSLPLILKVNTGMNRLGLSLQDLEETASRLKERGVEHLLTQLACAFHRPKPGDKTDRQYEEFRAARKLLEDAGVEVRKTSISNSGAIEQSIGIDETFVRPGLMLYGPSSIEPRIWEGHQVSRLSTIIMSTFRVKKGAPVGYGINVAPEDLFMAVVPMGYADGMLTFYSGTKLIIKGQKARVFGRVNMDMTFLAFDPSVEGKISVGERIDIWNHDNRSISDIAAQAKTSSYQVMCAISGRIPRIYTVK